MHNLGTFNGHWKNGEAWSRLDTLPPVSFRGMLLDLQIKWFKATRDGKQNELREQIAHELNELAALLWRELQAA